MLKKNNADTREEKIVFDKKEIASVVLKLTSIVAAVVLMLAVVNMFTKDKILQNDHLKTASALNRLFPGKEYEQIEVSDVESEENINAIYVMKESGKNVGCCIEVLTSGFSSEKIHLMVGVAAAEYSVVGIEIISSSETPGIGAAVLAKNGEYLRKFENTSKLSIPDIDTISGATITSKAVKLAVLEAVNASAAVLGGSGNG